jgi:hypothetical protein
MARGLNNSYGVRTERHPNRYVGRDPEPPPEEDYHEIGNTGRYTAPGGLMTVGFGHERPTSPPQSEQRERGIFSSPQFDQFGGSEFGLAPETNYVGVGPWGGSGPRHDVVDDLINMTREEIA